MNTTTPLLLDGAMGQEIVNRGGKAGYSEWAVAALYENPDLVIEIHSEYLRAGADIITTNSYSTTHARLRQSGMEDRLEELVRRAGSLAQAARAQTPNTRPQVQIAGGIGPLEASYISEFTLSYDEMVAQFDELMTLLTPYADLFLGETFSTVLEARAFLTAAKNHDKPVWFAWTLEDHGSTHLRSGQPITDAIESIASLDPDMILINCCTPNSISASVDMLKAAQIPFGAYANGFIEIPAEWDPAQGVSGQLSTRADLSPSQYAKHVMNWIKSGASVVGGCCDIGPNHIARLRAEIDGQTSPNHY